MLFKPNDMRYLFGILFFTTLLFSCQKDSSCEDPTALNVDSSSDCIYADSSQSALYFKFTGTWCPPCGSGGAIKMKKNLQENPNLIGIEVHYNDKMSSDISNKWVTFHKVNRYPTFIVNEGSSVSIPGALSKKAAVGFYQTYEVSGASMKVVGKVKALEDLPEGTYEIATYLMEDGFVEPQYASDHSAHPEWTFENGQYPNYIHDNIIRAEANDYIFGRVLREGDWKKGEIIDYEVEMDVFASIRGDVYPVTVIWKNENGHREFVNAIRTK